MRHRGHEAHLLPEAVQVCRGPDEHSLDGNLLALPITLGSGWRVVTLVWRPMRTRHRICGEMLLVTRETTRISVKPTVHLMDCAVGT